MFNKYLVAAGLAALLAANQASAAFVVDTGAPTGSFGLALDNTDWLAGQIALDHNTTIDTINAYLDDQGAGGGTFTISLYSDNSNKVGSLINTTSASFTSLGWNGASGLNWQVGPGNYWVAFEENDFNSFIATDGAPIPLQRTAYADGSHNGSYISFNGLSFGMQVGEVAAVPEPETYAMVLAGLGLIGFSVRRRQA